jgi:hypothetical protein
VWHHWVDESRDEPDDESAEAKREVIVELLYPAEVTADAQPAPYMDNAEQVLPVFTDLMNAFVAVPFHTQPNDLEAFQSYAYPNAALSEEQSSYPVLIFSHGGAADVRMYTAHLEVLASHGYIVAAINHACGAAITVLNDGRTVIPTYSTGLEGAALVWSEDQIFVMDQLEELNANDPDDMFTNRLDLERLGVFGQSLGGSATTITCFVDVRCKAGVNGDGPVFGDVIEQGVDQPFMLLLSISDDSSDPGFYDQARGPFYVVAVDGFGHLNFGDFPLWSNVEGAKDVGWLGSADGARSVEVTRASLLAFFDIYVKGNEGTVESALSDDYREITLSSRNVEP